jgi:hypothetical protein
LVLVACAPKTARQSVIDERLAALVPSDVSAIVGFRPAALGKVAATFGDAKYVLAWVRGAELGSAVLAADGSVSSTARADGARPAILGEGERLAAQYPGWAVIRGGTRLPLQGNLANLNNLLADAELVTAGVRPGEGYAVELTASCASEDRARRFEGSLRAVLLLIQAGPSAKVRREGSKVEASMTVPAEMLGKMVR